MKKVTITGIIYSVLTPLNVWVGYELGTENWNLAIPLVIFIMIIEFFNVRLRVEAQTESIEEHKKV